MATVNIDEWMPTLQFGFQLNGSDNVLCQLWMTAQGLTQWRPVPMIEVNEERKSAVAGYYDEDC